MTERRIKGIYADRPALVYVIHHAQLGAVKVGIANTGSARNMLGAVAVDVDSCTAAGGSP